MQTSQEQARSFQKRLIALRRQRGYSQAAFARAVGTSRRMMCYYEKDGRCLPPGGMLLNMSQVLGCSMDYLVGAETEQCDGRTVEGRLLSKFRDAAKLPEKERMLLVEMLDTLMSKNRLGPSTS